MAAKDIEAGRAHVVLRIKDLLSSGLQGIENRLSNFGRTVSLTGAGVFGAGAGIATMFAGVGASLFGAASSFAEAGSKLDDMSQRTGIAASSLSALSYAAQLSGTDIDAVEKSVSKMQKVVSEAVGGSTSAAEAFGHLGLKVSDLAGMNVEQQFSTIANAIADIEEPTMRNAAAMGVFGKSATDIVPMISGDIDALIDEAHALGVVMSDEDVSAAATLGDAFDKIGVVFSGVINTIGAAVAGPLTAIIETVVEIVGVANRWISANRSLVRIIAYLGVGGVVVGSVIAALGVVIVGVGGAFMAASAAISGIVAVFGFMGTVIATVFSPIGVLVAILAGLVGAAFYFRAALFEAFQGLVVWAQPVIDAFSRILWAGEGAVMGVVEALSAGNIQLAGTIAIAALKSMFWQAAHEIPGSATVLASSFGQALLAGRWDLIVGMAMTKAKLWVSDTAAGIGAIWDMLIYGMRTGWNSASTFLASAFLKAVAAINYSFVGLQVMFDALVTGAKIAANAVHGFFTGSSDQAAAQNKKLAEELAARTGKRSEEARTYDTGLQKTLAEDAARTQAQIRKDFETSFMKRAGGGEELRKQLADLENQARTAASDQGVTTAAAAADKARAELDAAISSAADAKAATEKNLDISTNVPGLKTAGNALPKNEARGTFSAAAAMLFGGGSNANEQTAQNTLAMKRYLKDIKDKPGAVFA